MTRKIYNFWESNEVIIAYSHDTLSLTNEFLNIAMTKFLRNVDE